MVVKALKELKNRLDARARRDEVKRDEEGRAILEMNVRSDEDFLSDFSVGSSPTIGSEVAEFIEESAKAFSPRERVHVRIHSRCINKSEEEIYEGALKEYYVRRYKDNGRKLRLNAVASLIFTMVGLTALALAITFSVLGWNAVLGEAIDIFAWVFLWEAVDLFFLERMALKAERARYLRFIDAKVEFLRTE